MADEHDGWGRAGERPTRAHVDLSALTHNLGVVRSRAGSSVVYPVVKANAYGHGLVPVAVELVRAGADGLCVALVEEALDLRTAGMKCPILVLNGVYGSSHAAAIEAELTPVVYRPDQVEAFGRAAGQRQIEVHLKLDTGMSRLGASAQGLDSLLDACAAAPNVVVAGFMTHLASSECDPELTALQLQRFHAGLERVRARGHRPTVLHAANSGAVFTSPESQLDLVRPGIAIYGISPGGDIQVAPLRPVLSLLTQVIALRTIEAGDSVGYGQSFRSERRTRVATLPIGYGDGLLRSASNRAHMIVGGTKCRVIGAVSMDLTCLDVTGVPECRVADDVVIIGQQGSVAQSADELAEACQTIGYEVVTHLSPRVPRLYGPDFA